MDYQTLKDLYLGGMSTYAIAKQEKLNPSAVLRLLKKYKIPLRSRSEAQANYLKSGKHPTKGTNRSEEEKIAIGRSMNKVWKDESFKKTISDKAKENWNKMTAEEKKLLYKKAGDGVRKASKDGSKLEHFLKNFLTAKGVEVEFHKTLTVSGLEVDLYLPEWNTAIEVDGPSHFSPVWGVDKMTKQQVADKKKKGLIVGGGYNYIRVVGVACTLARSTAAAEKVFNSLGSKFVEIEV